MQQQWFETWFDSPYYHILYKHRDDTEAQFFMDNLIRHIKPSGDAQILDLACGKGRHSRYLAGKNLHVTGIDLSEQSIREARKYEHEQLDFYTHDMRKVFKTNYFDYIFNLFTSFGYFSKDSDDVSAAQSIYKGVKSGGYFIMDFLNTTIVENNLVEEEVKEIENIHFLIKRSIENGRVIKQINFTDNGHSYSFEESVKLFSADALEKLFTNVGFELKEIFGDYDLNAFDAESSERLILIFKK